MIRLHGVGSAALIGALLVPACSSDRAASSADESSDPPARAIVASRTIEYRGGLMLDIRIPDNADHDTPVVVLVPGGAWRTADRTGLNPLAVRLASAGLVSATITMRAADDRVRFPVPIADVLCAVASAAEQAELAGVRGPVAIVGHSSGAHLAALAALAAGRFADPACPHPPRAPDALVGLAGIYDLALVPDVAEALMGTSRADAPDRWLEASPRTWVGERPQVPVLLAHGDDDELVPPAFSEAFSDQLRAAGHEVTLYLAAGADHQSIYAAAVIGPTLEQWLATLDARDTVGTKG